MGTGQFHESLLFCIPCRCHQCLLYAPNQRLFSTVHFNNKSKLRSTPVRIFKNPSGVQGQADFPSGKLPLNLVLAKP